MRVASAKVLGQEEVGSVAWPILRKGKQAWVAGAWRARMTVTDSEVGEGSRGQAITSKKPYKLPESLWLKRHPKVGGGAGREGLQGSDI